MSNRKRYEAYNEACARRARESYHRKRQKQIANGKAKMFRLQEEDKQFIQEHPDMSGAEIARYLGCSTMTANTWKKKLSTSSIPAFSRAHTTLC